MKQCRMDCIHAEACRRFADNNTYWNSGDCPIYKPTADVAPKSEIDKLHEVIFMKEDLMQSIAKERNHYYDELQKTKQEVAREIFEEIEKITNSSIEKEHFKGAWFNMAKFEERLAELKKKYTEGETDERAD